MRLGKPTNRNTPGSLRLGSVTPAPAPSSTDAPHPVERVPIPADPQPTGGHRLLSGDAHLDTVEALCVTGDLVYGNANTLWDRLAVGATDQVLRVTGGIPAWRDFAHVLLSGDHSDTLTGTVTRGSLIYGNATPKWARLALGAGGTVLKSDGTDLAWSADAHNLLSARHGDTTAASPTRGDLITAQGASPTWSRLAKSGTATHVLKAGANEPAWGQAAFSELSGTLTDAQHGALTTGSSHQVGGDLSGTTAAATVAKLQGKGVAIPATPGNDNQFLQFNGTSLVWATPSTSSVSIIVQEGDGTVEAAATTLDFGPGFDVTSLPSGEANITLDLAEVVSGDVAFTANAATVAQIQGKAVATPSSSGTYARYNGTSIAWSAVPHTDLTFTGLTGGHVFRASGASAAAFAQLQHSDLGGVGANDHHNQAHTLFSTSDHSDVTGTPASGDLIYRNGSSQWARLPKGSDGQILKLGSGLPTWAAVNSVATASCGFQAWRRQSIGNAGASPTYNEMTGIEGVKTGVTMPRSGTIIGVALDLSADIANGTSYSVQAYTRTPGAGAAFAASGVIATLTGTAGSDDMSAYGNGSAAFAAGDQITLFDSRSGLAGSTIDSKATVFVVLN